MRRSYLVGRARAGTDTDRTGKAMQPKRHLVYEGGIGAHMCDEAEWWLAT